MMGYNICSETLICVQPSRGREQRVEAAPLPKLQYSREVSFGVFIALESNKGRACGIIFTSDFIGCSWSLFLLAHLDVSAYGHFYLTLRRTYCYSPALLCTDFFNIQGDT